MSRQSALQYICLLPTCLFYASGAIALVMLFFLVVTLGFERLVHAVKHFLTKRKRFGLVAAVNSMSNEIMLLGLAALILVAIETPLTNKCARVETRMRPWLSHVHDCACCLTRTRGVTDCFLQVHGAQLLALLPVHSYIVTPAACPLAVVMVHRHIATSTDRCVSPVLSAS